MGYGHYEYKDSKRINIHLANDSAIPLLGISSREMKNMCTQIPECKCLFVLFTNFFYSQFIHNSFIHNCPNWKQPKCSSTVKWISKLWCGILLSNKRNILLIYTAWMKLKSNMLSERSQTQKITFSDSNYVTFWGKRQTYRPRNQTSDS